MVLSYMRSLDFTIHWYNPTDMISVAELKFVFVQGVTGNSDSAFQTFRYENELVSMSTNDQKKINVTRVLFVQIAKNKGA